MALDEFLRKRAIGPRSSSVRVVFDDSSEARSYDGSGLTITDKRTDVTRLENPDYIYVTKSDVVPSLELWAVPSSLAPSGNAACRARMGSNDTTSPTLPARDRADQRQSSPRLSAQNNTGSRFRVVQLE